MHVVIRSYSGQGASDLFDALAEREDDVKSVLSTVPGSSATQRSAMTTVDKR